MLHSPTARDQRSLLGGNIGQIEPTSPRTRWLPVKLSTWTPRMQEGLEAKGRGRRGEVQQNREEHNSGEPGYLSLRQHHTYRPVKTWPAGFLDIRWLLLDAHLALVPRLALLSLEFVEYYPAVGLGPSTPSRGPSHRHLDTFPQFLFLIADQCDHTLHKVQSLPAGKSRLA